ncbi:hypothetical protein KJ764_01185 [Patescibacteria group bacterium]|nr:hypothetical protein [Patescibacteria group bacterium]
MKNKKLCAVITGVAVLANMFLFGLAAAGNATSDVEVTAGTHEIVGNPIVVNFASVATATVEQNTTDAEFAVDSFMWKDTRGNGAATVVISATATGFVNTVDMAETFSGFTAADLYIRSDLNDTLTATGSSDCATGISLVTPLTAFSGNGGSQNIIDADSRERVVECSMQPVLDLNVPALTPVGTWRATLTYSIV